MDAAVTPFPSELTTPPVTKIYLVTRSILSSPEASQVSQKAGRDVYHQVPISMHREELSCLSMRMMK